MIAVSKNSSLSGNPSSTPESIRMTQRQRGLQQACLAARALDDFRGQDTIVLDLTGITPIVDYFVVTTGTSSRQMRAMAEEVHRVLKQEGSKRIGLEGAEGSTWILQDYGDIVIHIFTGEGRDLYDLERLWGDAPRIDWKSHCPPTPRPQAAASEPRSEPADVQPTDAEPTTND